MSALFSPSETNVFGYLARTLETLGERPLSDVDSLVLSCLSYFRYQGDGVRSREGVPVRDLFRAEWLEGMTRGLWDPEGLVRLLALVSCSPRFRDVRVSDYVDDFDELAEKQFSACVLRLPGGGAYVSFRGTDNTLVGWKEDFNMAFETGVPSQYAAIDYFERVVPTIEGPIYLGGHSKGGNLAVYAAAHCPGRVAGRIARAFSHDGPGFTKEALADGLWGERSGIVSKTVPRSSVIGMLFERQEDYAVIESSTAGLMQHDPFSWVVRGADFVRQEGLGRGASFVDKGLNEWIASMTRAEREGFVETLFSVLGAAGEDTFTDLGSNWQASAPAMLRRIGELEPGQRANAARALSLLVHAFMPDIELPQLPGFELPQFSELDGLLSSKMGPEEPAEAEEG